MKNTFLYIVIRYFKLFGVLRDFPAFFLAICTSFLHRFQFQFFGSIPSRHFPFLLSSYTRLRAFCIGQYVVACIHTTLCIVSRRNTINCLRGSSKPSRASLREAVHNRGTIRDLFREIYSLGIILNSKTAKRVSSRLIRLINVSFKLLLIYFYEVLLFHSLLFHFYSNCDEAKNMYTLTWKFIIINIKLEELFKAFYFNAFRLRSIFLFHH